MFGFLKRKRVDLLSPLSIELCVQKVQEQIDSSWNSSGTALVVGKVKNNTLRLRKRIAYRNSFQDTLEGDIEKTPNGTRINCRIGLSSFVRGFVILWLSVVLLFTGFALFGEVAEILMMKHDPLSALNVSLLLPLALPSFFFVILYFGRMLAKSESQFLIEFMFTSIGAATIESQLEK